MNIWNKLKTGRGISLLVVAVIFIIAIVWAIAGKTSNEIADLTLSPASINTTAGSSFNLIASLDSKTNDVVVVKAVVDYNVGDFELTNINTDSSVFAEGNACQYEGKPCEIITEDAVNGKAIITLSKPSPGVNTASGTLAILTFKALRAVQPSAENITLHYIAFGSYDDSDVIFDGVGDNGEGSDILNNVTNSTVSAVLPTPKNFAVTDSSATQTDLSWTDTFGSDVGITGYKIYRDGLEVGATASTTYQDSELTPLTTYNYQVSAYNSGGNESTLTSQVVATTLADTNAPTVPASLNATASAMDVIDLSWIASTDNVAVTGYRIYRDETEIDTTTGITYQDTGLTPSTAYSYTVLAYDEAGNNSTQTSAVPATTSTDSEDPTAPTNLTATAVSISQIDLSWDASADNIGVIGYRIYRGGSVLDTTTNTNYSDTGLATDTSYSYTVLAYDAEENESAQTASVSATTNSDTVVPTAPAGLTATPASMTQINLSWTASTDNVGVTGYRIYRDGTEIATISNTTYQDTGLAEATDYSYAVLAYDVAGNSSAQSSPVSATTLTKTYGLTDFNNLVGDWLQDNSSSEADVNGDGVVNTRDLGIMMSNWE